MRLVIQTVFIFLFLIGSIIETPVYAQSIGVGLNFGTVPIGQSKDLTMSPLFVSNTGITPYGCRDGMKMGKLTISGLDGRDFKIVNDGISGKICLPFSHLSATIEFTPSKEGREFVNIIADVQARDTKCEGVYSFPSCTAVGNGEYTHGTTGYHPIAPEFYTHLHLIVHLNSSRLGIMTVQEESRNSPPKFLASFLVGNVVPTPNGDPIKRNMHKKGPHPPFPPGTWPIYTDKPGWLEMPAPTPISEGVAFIIVGTANAESSQPGFRQTGIHGGRGSYTKMTWGCLRMNDADLLALIKILKDDGSTNTTELTVPAP